MSDTSAVGSAVTLDQLTALNQELAALARAGVPLDQGLLHLGRDMPGRLGQLASQLGQRLESGQPLDEALRGIGQMPPAYAALVAAGVRSGRLAVALDDMATLIRRVGEMQRLMVLALIYPLLLLILAMILFSFTLQTYFPIVHEFYHSVSPDGRALIVVKWMADAQPYWWPAVAVIIAVSLAVWWVRQRRALTHVQSAGRRRRARNRATIGNVIYSGRLAVLTETLAALIEHGVPLAESLRLAGDACGDRRLGDAVRQLADRLEAGQRPSEGGPLPGISRLLGLILAYGTSSDQLAATLRRMSQAYRQDAVWMSRWVAVYLPLNLTVLIGGTATIAYAFSVIWPFANILWELAYPHVS
jgi:type II secretory pathway component PulF